VTSSTHGGVLFRVGTDAWFLPASIAMKVLPTPEMARVPGAPPELRGVALVDGNMIPVVDLLCDGAPLSSVTSRNDLEAARSRGGRGKSSKAMLVCVVLGEPVGLVGLEVVATGRFETTASGEVRHGAESARVFDVASVIAKVREGRWAV
jgi:chemotaxis signal transduction protein